MGERAHAQSAASEGFASALARAAYSTLLWLLQPFALWRWWRRGREEPGYRLALGERWGRYPSTDADAAGVGGLWVHAVSLGETRAAEPLISALRRARPGLPLLLTHGTATGREAGRALLQPGDRQAWLPLDTPAAVSRFLRHFRPRVGVLMETEVWPNLLAACRRVEVPVVLASARLSAKSLRQGQRYAALMRPAAAAFSAVLAQSEADAERLRAAGGRQVQVCGNLKFDLTPPASQLDQGAAWRAGSARPMVLAASTREGEEALLLAAWRALPQPRPRLVIVPRHPQRFGAVGGLIQAAGFTLAARSAWGERPDTAAQSAEVWLGDSMGEMALWYAAAEVALLGGSFLPFGGQNLIEAAACGCPVLMGPHTYNFAEASALAIEAGAAERVEGIDQAVVRAAALASTAAGRSQRDAMAARALAFTAAHRGAARRMAERIVALLPPAPAAATRPDR